MLRLWRYGGTDVRTEQEKGMGAMTSEEQDRKYVPDALVAAFFPRPPCKICGSTGFCILAGERGAPFHPRPEMKMPNPTAQTKPPCAEPTRRPHPGVIHPGLLPDYWELDCDDTDEERERNMRLWAEEDREAHRARLLFLASTGGTP